MINKIIKNILIRFSDNMFSVGNVIDYHQEVINQSGFVWFGKIGSPIGQNHIDEINKQIEENIQSTLFLVKGNRKKQTFYKAKILRLQKEFPENEKNAIPQYYFDKDLIKNMKFWAKITDIQEVMSEDINKIKVIGSVNTIDETLYRSSSGHFFVREIKDS